MMRGVVIAVSCAFSWGSAAAGLEPGESGVVGEVIDGDTFVLDDGLEVRLIGLQAPMLPLGRPGFPTWPFAPEARAALIDLIGGRTVQLAYGGARRDRYGRALAHVYRGDGLWVQGEMVRRGVARVYSFKDNRSCVAELLDLEREARENTRGLWRLDAYRVRRADETYDALESYQLVEGTVRAAARVNGRTFLNFGADWRTDFTATVAPADLDAFDGIDLLALGGQGVRVRGWLGELNGPNMVLTHPEQLEVPASKGAAGAATESPCLDGGLI